MTLILHNFILSQGRNYDLFKRLSLGTKARIDLSSMLLAPMGKS